MPLKEGSGKEAVSHNIRAELKSGKSKAQAIAIALAVARRAKAKRKKAGRKGHRPAPKED